MVLEHPALPRCADVKVVAVLFTEIGGDVVVHEVGGRRKFAGVLGLLQFGHVIWGEGRGETC